MSTPPILSRPIEVLALPPGGVERHVSTTEAERAALAEACGLRAVRSLAADLLVMPEPHGVVSVTGRVVAEIVQTCVVSLAPVEEVIDEPVAIRFAPPGDAVPQSGAGELDIDPESEDPPDPLTGSTIDLGAITEEFFVLAINPYPRAPGAELAPPGESGEPDSNSPFAALAGLRAKGERGS